MAMSYAEAEEARMVLQKVAIYREVCEAVRKGSTSTLVFGVIMLALWYGLIPEGQKFKLYGLVFLCLALLEFGTGFLNRFFPSAEGILLEGLVLVCFGGWNVAREVMIWQKMMPGAVSPVFVALGFWWLFQGFKTSKSYFQIRKLFAERPTAEHLQWFNTLIKEIRTADPASDPQAFTTTNDPLLAIKLLGDTAIILLPDDTVDIVAREEMELEVDSSRPEKLRARLSIQGAVLPWFRIDEANLRNFVNWKKDELDDIPEARPIG